MTIYFTIGSPLSPYSPRSSPSYQATSSSPLVFRPAPLDWLGSRDEKTLSLNGDMVRYLDDSRQRFFIGAGVFYWPGVIYDRGDNDGGDSDVIKLKKGLHSDSNVGGSDVSREEGGREGQRDRAGDSDKYRQVGTRRS